ncbi:MAG: polyprenyl synthetase family protein [Planctomycetota bacterium]
MAYCATMSTGVPVKISEAMLIEQIDSSIASAIDGRDFPARLQEAMRYSALGQGKRVRPLLCLWTCMAVNGGSWPQPGSMAAAAALEMVHAFSLVHDDLPAMDDDDLRRGQPTVHIRFDEATAVLAGDALQALALEIILNQPAPWAKRAAFELAVATNQMISGQILDTLGGDPDQATDSDADQLLNIHRLKTGGLIRASCRIGALVAGVHNETLNGVHGIDGGGHGRWGTYQDESELAELTRYADALGLMFQAVDDLLDVTSDAATLGKATQKDAEAGKLTYPGVFGVDGTRREIARLHEEAVAALESFGPSADPLRNLAQRLATRTR